VAAQDADPNSMLWLHRDALRLRRELPGLQGEDFAWCDSTDGVLDFRRGDGFRCLVNIGGMPVDPDPEWEVLLASRPLVDGAVPHDAAVWLGRRVTEAG
jgi:alpha-glucosidase